MPLVAWIFMHIVNIMQHGKCVGMIFTHSIFVSEISYVNLPHGRTFHEVFYIFTFLLYVSCTISAWSQNITSTFWLQVHSVTDQWEFSLAVSKITWSQPRPCGMWTMPLISLVFITVAAAVSWGPGPQNTILGTSGCRSTSAEQQK